MVEADGDEAGVEEGGEDGVDVIEEQEPFIWFNVYEPAFWDAR